MNMQHMKTNAKTQKTEIPVESLALDSLILDETIQSRVKIDQRTVKEYAERMKAGKEFPPIIVFEEGQSRLVADGFHRVPAAIKAGFSTIPSISTPPARPWPKP
jgi:ParB-like chromosome segregation protein Spo0J